MMRRFAFALALALTACTPALNLTDPAGPRFASDARTERTALARPTPDSLLVVTFNIEFGKNIERAIDVLRTPPLRAADIVCLQEVDEEDVARIARALHLEYVYYPSSVHPRAGRHFGPAVLSAWPIERDWKLVLPHLSITRQQHRTATAAVIRAGDVRVRIYSVHLELPLSVTPAQRSEQVERVLADAAGTTAPVIVAGDTNGADVAWQFIDAGFAWATRTVGATAHVFPADHVFARGFAPVRAGALADARGASDHRPVWTVLRRDGPLDTGGGQGPK